MQLFKVASQLGFLKLLIIHGFSVKFIKPDCLIYQALLSVNATKDDPCAVTMYFQ